MGNGHTHFGNHKVTVKMLGMLCHRTFVADLELAIGGATDCSTSKVRTFLTSRGATPAEDVYGPVHITHDTTLELPADIALELPGHTILWGDLANNSM